MFRVRHLCVAAVLVSAAACDGTPTQPISPLPKASRDAVTGYGLGSGNKADSTQAVTPNTTAAGVSETSAAGGYGLGSGN